MSQDDVLFCEAGEGKELIKYPAGKAIQEYVIPSDVTKIHSEAFECCESLISVSIPESVMDINGLQFINCGNLEKILVDEKIRCILQKMGFFINMALTIKIYFIVIPKERWINRTTFQKM